MAFGIMNEYQKERFKATNEVDLAYGVPGLGRFRVNVFQQRGTIGVGPPRHPFQSHDHRELMLPKVLEKIALDERGLILVTGTTGSGKSHHAGGDDRPHQRQRDQPHHDHRGPHRVPHPGQALHREPARGGRGHGMSFSQALKSALRQDPDVILVGEMRDLETIETALTAAETGHLVMSTLHTLDATETINRIISVFPPYQQKQVRLQLGSVLKAVVSQRLVPRADGKGRVAAVEVLIATARVRELIEDKDRTKEIPDAIAQGHQTYGMQTFDQSLMELVRQNLITYDEALPPGHQPGRLCPALQRHQRNRGQQVGRLRGPERRRQRTRLRRLRPARRPPAGAPAPTPARPSAAVPRPPPQPLPTPPRSATQAAPRTATPQPQAATGGDDDFQIERF